MDLVEKPNLGEKLIQLYKSQLIKLPATVLKQIAKADEVKGYAEVGKAFSKKLEKERLSNYQSELIIGLHYFKNNKSDLSNKYFLKV